ncbi:MAG: bacteriocin [Firmicutes bacterium]|nr:bacteriocin [Candidatus Colivicinus equi]
MAKTQEELNQLKEEYETLTNKLKELTEDELKQVAGGVTYDDAKSGITMFHEGDCFININYPNEPYYVPRDQPAPSKYDFVYLASYTAYRNEWTIVPIMYYLFDLEDGIYVYHPELNNVNYNKQK